MWSCRIIQKKNHKLNVQLPHLRLLFCHTQRDLHLFQTTYDEEILVTIIIKISKLATRREKKGRSNFLGQETPNYLVWNIEENIASPQSTPHEISVFKVSVICKYNQNIWAFGKLVPIRYKHSTSPNFLL